MFQLGVFVMSFLSESLFIFLSDISLFLSGKASFSLNPVRFSSSDDDDDDDVDDNL